MQPFDHAWQLLKSYTSEPARTLDDTDRHVREHRVAGKKNLGLPLSLTTEDLNELQSRPTEFENRQFNVMGQELEPANFSTGQDMSDRLSISEKAARESDPDDYDYRPKIDGMRVNQNPNYPSLSRDDMSLALRYPYPKDANNPGDFAGGY